MMRKSHSESFSDRARNLGCTSKIAYPTPKAALSAGVAFKKKAGGKIAFYHCHFCGQYHLTSQAH